MNRNAPMKFVGIAGLIVAALLVAISPESFWIDEVTTAWLARQETWTGLVRAVRESGSEAQMPVFVGYIWLWAKLCGASEVALRCANIPWAIATVVGLEAMRRRMRIRVPGLLLLVSPLVCFYMNEARPYIMTLGSAALSLASVDILGSPPTGDEGGLRRAARICLPCGLAVCVGSSLLNLFIVPALAVYAIRLLLPGGGHEGSLLATLRDRFRREWVPLVFSAGIVVALGGYYAWTLSAGHGGQKEPFRLANLGFAAYEWLGFGGLGAPRNELREIGARSAVVRYAGTLALGLLAWGLAGAAMARNRHVWAQDRRWQAASAAFLAGFGFLVAAAVAAPASLWGRHFIFLLPFGLLALGRALQPEESAGSHLWRRLAMPGLLAMFCLSAGRQRFLESYEKDPFRSAVAWVGEQVRMDAGRPVVWVSYPLAVTVYGGTIRDVDARRPESAGCQSGGIVSGAGWNGRQIAEWTARSPRFLLVMHRADKNDPGGGWSRFVREEALPKVWQKGNISVYEREVPEDNCRDPG